MGHSVSVLEWLDSISADLVRWELLRLFSTVQPGLSVSPLQIWYENGLENVYDESSFVSLREVPVDRERRIQPKHGVYLALHSETCR